jgi:hypothetical protein
MSQVDRLYKLLSSDFGWHTTPEILERVYGCSHLGIARISARIFDVKSKYNVEIESELERDSLWKYRLKRPLDKRNLLD